MSGKEFCLIKELTYSRLTAICAFEPPFFAYLLCGSLLKCDVLFPVAWKSVVMLWRKKNIELVSTVTC